MTVEDVFMDELSKPPGAADMDTPFGSAEIMEHLSAQDRDDLVKAVSLLKQYGATGVYLFGSMATGGATEGSDWDFAVEGLPSSAFLPALTELASALRRPVDLVELDDGSRFASYLRSWESLLHVA